MHSYSLKIDELLHDDYHLIGIHTALEDYRLAFLLNAFLGLKFKRAPYDLDFERKLSKASYSVYEYISEKLDYDWFLISNVFKSTKTTHNSGLFNESDTRTFLVPEKKRVDYFLKIEGDVSYDVIAHCLEVLNKAMPQIITSYTIEINTLKSKEFLIF